VTSTSGFLDPGFCIFLNHSCSLKNENLPVSLTVTRVYFYYAEEPFMPIFTASRAQRKATTCKNSQVSDLTLHTPVSLIIFTI
jgi:hypothetical protein